MKRWWWWGGDEGLVMKSRWWRGGIYIFVVVWFCEIRRPLNFWRGRVGPGWIYFGKKLTMVSVKGVSARKCRFPDWFSSSGTFASSGQMLLVFLEIGWRLWFKLVVSSMISEFGWSNGGLIASLVRPMAYRSGYQGLSVKWRSGFSFVTTVV